MNTKIAEKARRDREMKEGDGKQHSLRPSIPMKMKTKYTRNNKHKGGKNEIPGEED
jgi:hypothetical protein